MQEFQTLDKHYSQAIPLCAHFLELPKVIVASLADRWDLISDKVYAAAHLVDPRWRDIDLEQADFLDGEKVIERMAGVKWNRVIPNLPNISQFS